MSKHKMPQKAQKGATETIYCGMCANSYDDFEKDYQGKNFMTHCPFFELPRMMRHDTCDKAKRK